MNKYRKVLKRDENVKIIKTAQNKNSTRIKRQETLPDELSSLEENLETFNLEINTSPLSTTHIS